MPETFENASPDGKNRPRSRLTQTPATVALSKMGGKSHSAQRSCIIQNLIADLGFTLAAGINTLAAGINGLQQFGAPFYIEQFFNGGALVLAISLAKWAEGRRPEPRGSNKMT